MRNLFSDWLKRQCGIIDRNGDDMMNYLLMKVDYLSERVVYLESENKKLLSDIVDLNRDLENAKSDFKSDLEELDRSVDNIKSDVEMGNFNYIWEVLDELQRDYKDLEVPDESDIRDIIQRELDALEPEQAQLETEDADNIRKMVVNTMSDLMEHRVRIHSHTIWKKIGTAVEEIIEEHTNI